MLLSVDPVLEESLFSTGLTDNFLFSTNVCLLVKFFQDFNFPAFSLFSSDFSDELFFELLKVSDRFIDFLEYKNVDFAMSRRDMHKGR